MDNWIVDVAGVARRVARKPLSSMVALFALGSGLGDVAMTGRLSAILVNPRLAESGDQSLRRNANAFDTRKPFASALVAFLHAGEVWTVPGRGGVPTRITRTGARVDDFRISRDGAFLAYSKRIRKAPERPITSIVVVNIATSAVLTEIRPTSGWLDLDGWIGTTLVYHSSQELEVTGTFEYDVIDRISHELDMSRSFFPTERDVSRDGSIRLFVDDTGRGMTYRQRLHIVDSRAGAAEVDATHRNVMSPALSSDASAVGFIDVVDSVLANGAPRPVRYRVWIHRRNALDVMIYERPIQASGDGIGLTWATDGTRLALNYGGIIDVLDANRPGPPVRSVPGENACWIDADQLALTSTSGQIVVLSLATGAERILAPHGTASQCIDA